MPAFRIAVVPRCRKATSGTAAASRARSAKEAKRFCGTFLAMRCRDSNMGGAKRNRIVSVVRWRRKFFNQRIVVMIP